VVDHAVQNLPRVIKQALESSEGLGNPADILALLRQSIISFDDRITNGLLDLFPGGVEAVRGMSDDEIRAIAVVDGKPHPAVALSMCGTTALVALVDPNRNLYVASLGDCLAGMVALHGRHQPD
jgi:pyruvate dehydrogenase phosphatase